MTEMKGTGTHYRLENQEWSVVWNELKPAEIRILYHLRTLNPFGDRPIEIKVRELGRELNMAHSTVSRALKTLDAKKFIDLDLVSVNVKVLSRGVVSTDTTGAYRHQERSVGTTVDREAPLDDSELIAQPLTTESSEEFLTDPLFVPDQTDQTCSNNRSGASIPEPINRKGFGTSLEDISNLIPAMAGIPLNPSLSSVISSIWSQDPEGTETRVRNAISSYLEQREIVKNPQAFISSALRRGFTSNTAKKQKRTSTKTASKQKQKREKTIVPPPVTATDLSSAIALIEVHCSRLGLTKKQALQRYGLDRPFTDLSPYEIECLQDAVARW